MKNAIIGLSILWTLFFQSYEARPQSKPNLREIPADLLITLKEQQGWGGYLSEITINANGDVSTRLTGGQPALGKFQDLSHNKSTSKILKPHLSADGIRSLLAEFERIQFHRFSDDFPAEEKQRIMFVTDQGTQTISIRVNGQTKEVSNYLGEFSQRSEILRNLTTRIWGARVWNYENGKIPDDLQVRYRTNDGRNIWDVYIYANGKVVEGITSTRYFYNKDGTVSNRLSQPKMLGQLSKETIRKLINEFAQVGFSNFRASTPSQLNMCPNPLVTNGEPKTSISVQINKLNDITALLYESCDSQPDSNAVRFEHIERILRDLAKSVGGLGSQGSGQ